MRMRIFALVAVIAFIASGMAACRKAKQSDNVVAVFEGGSITREDLSVHYRSMKMDSRFNRDREQLTPQYAFEHAVNMEMIIAKGLKENLHLAPEIRGRIHNFMADLFIEVMQERLVPEINKADFSEEEVRAWFDSHPEVYCTPALYDVRVIKTADRETINNIRAAVLSGDVTFEQAAGKWSIDKETGEKGGVLGKKSLKEFTAGWRQSIADLDPGALSEPLIMDDNWYLLRVEDRTEPVPYDFEKKKAYVRNDLLYARYKDAWQEVYDHLKEEFSLEVDEAALEDFLKGEDS